MKNADSKQASLVYPPFKLKLLTPGQTQSAAQSPLLGTKAPMEISIPQNLGFGKSSAGFSLRSQQVKAKTPLAELQKIKVHNGISLLSSGGGSIFNPPTANHINKHMNSNAFDCSSSKSGGSTVVGLSMRLRDLKFRDKQDALYQKMNRAERREVETGIHTGK